MKNILTFKKLVKEDQGTYICRSISEYDSLIGIADKTVNLRVKCVMTLIYFLFESIFYLDKPRRNPQDSTTVWINRNDLNKSQQVIVDIICKVNSDPPSVISWFTIDGIQISDGNYPKIEYISLPSV